MVKGIRENLNRETLPEHVGGEGENHKSCRAGEDDNTFLTKDIHGVHYASPFLICPGRAPGKSLLAAHHRLKRRNAAKGLGCVTGAGTVF
jgi:hypothetical protein